MQWKKKQNVISKNVSRSFIQGDQKDLEEPADWKFRDDNEEDQILSQSMRQKAVPKPNKYHLNEPEQSMPV